VQALKEAARFPTLFAVRRLREVNALDEIFMVAAYPQPASGEAFMESMPV
jgi:hypothetical protein